MPRSTIKTTTALAGILMAITMPVATSAQGVDLPTSCSPQADAAIDEGLTLLHNMMYIQAEAAFNRSAASDPDCAMAQWGIAMSNFHPLWPGGPTEEETARGNAAASKLAKMAMGNDLENAFAAAAAAFYSPEHNGYRDRIAAWSDAQVAAYQQNPDNVDAAALAAMAKLANAPGGAERIKTYAEAGELLDSLYKMAPDHPGVIHYAIHAFDNAPLKDRGLPYAKIYDKTAPTAPHALHMPAHIFTRTGDWAESIDLNRRSAEAALEQSDGILQSHYAHAIDYMVYGHLQIGEPEKAEALVNEMLDKGNHQVSFGGAYALAASPVRLLLEQDKWAEAAALPSDLHPAIPWKNFPQTVSMLWFAKGLGAARTGDIEAASNAVQELGTLHATMEEKGQKYWAQLTEAQILTVEAWIELAQGNDDLAVTLQTKAADLEDEIGKSPVTPGHVLPAHELLGDMYSERGQVMKAAEAYQATLALSPNRKRSLAALD